MHPRLPEDSLRSASGHTEDLVEEQRATPAQPPQASQQQHITATAQHRVVSAVCQQVARGSKWCAPKGQVAASASC